MLSQARPCILENALTGEVIEADSIVHFCEKAGIPDSRFHITPVLDGERIRHKGWYLPAFLDQTLHLKDIYSTEYQMTVREWIKQGRSAALAHRLLTGQKKSEMGSRLMLASTQIDSPIRPRNTFTTEVKLTDGKRVFKGVTISEASQAAGFDQPGSIYEMAYGFRDKARGLRVKSIKVEQKRLLT